MKTFSLFKRGVAIAFAVLAVSVITHAQDYPRYAPPGFYIFSWGNNAVTNFANPPYFDVSRSQVTTFAMGSTSQGNSSTSNTAYLLAPSVDGINMDTNHTVTLYGGTCAANTPLTKYQWTCTNLTTSGVQGYYLIAATNPPTAAGVLNTNYIGNGMKLSSP